MRKTKIVTIEAAGRDQGKIFLLTELSAAAAERWGIRAMLALTHAGIDIDEEMQNAGMAGIAIMGVRALGRMTFAEAAPLLDEMFHCIRRVEDRRLPDGRPLVNNGGEGDDIEEVATRLFLRSEVFKLHVDFTTAAALFPPAAAMMAQEGSDTSISPIRSAS